VLLGALLLRNTITDARNFQGILEELVYGHLARRGEKRNTCRLVGKSKGKRTLRRSRRKSVDNIKIDIGQIGWDDVHWIGLVQKRDKLRALVNRVMNPRILLNARKLSSGCTTDGL
jgi:hypothetical protein